MKKVSHQGIILGILILSICSCTIQDDSIQVNARSAASTEKEPPLTCDKLLDSPEEYEGQVINLDAISWGSNPSVDGEEILMSLADQKLVGLQQAHVLVHFTKDQEKDIDDIDENDSISITATVGAYEYGALRLIEAKISPKKVRTIQN
jgi:hypothetical protein